MNVKANKLGDPVETPAEASALARSTGFAWQHRWSMLGITLMLMATAMGAARLILGPEIVTALVMRGDLAQTVLASGHIETPYQVKIASQITGTVEDVLVLEGEEVKQGESLIVIESSELQAAVLQTEGAAAEAEARVRQLRELTKPAADQALVQAQVSQTGERFLAGSEEFSQINPSLLLRRTLARSVS